MTVRLSAAQVDVLAIKKVFGRPVHEHVLFLVKNRKHLSLTVCYKIKSFYIFTDQNCFWIRNQSSI